jgi:hypothetical protein
MKLHIDIKLCYNKHLVLYIVLDETTKITSHMCHELQPFIWKKSPLKKNEYKGNGFHIQVPSMLHGALMGVHSLWAMLRKSTFFWKHNKKLMNRVKWLMNKHLRK